MARSRWLTISVVVLLVIGMTSIAMAEGRGPVTKATGKDAAELIPAFEMFPDSVYDSAFTRDYGDATGKVNMIQPNGNVDVILAISADGLTPGTTYTVFFDNNGITQDDVATAGPWVNKGQFVADEEGHGEWNYTVPAGTLGTGDYVLSVFINDGLTMLISYNVEFSIVE